MSVQNWEQKVDSQLELHEVWISELREEIKNNVGPAGSPGPTGPMGMAGADGIPGPPGINIDFRDHAENIKILANLVMDGEITRTEYNKVLFLLESSTEDNRQFGKNILMAKMTKMKKS